MTCLLAGEFAIARPSFRRRLAGRCSSRLPTRPVLLSASGSSPWTLATADICSQAVSRESHICRRGNMPASSIDGRTAPGSIARHMARILCAERSRHRFTRRPAICEQCSCCSVTRHTAREHTTEAKVHYPYHPQFGEAVIVRRRLFTHNVEMAVILQPDGSLACLPAWMLAESAAQYRICRSPTISIAFLQSLRVEIDALLASLPSDSEMGDERHAAKFQNTRKQATRAVRANPARNRGDSGPATTANDAGRSPAERDRLGARNRGGQQ